MSVGGFLCALSGAGVRKNVHFIMYIFVLDICCHHLGNVCHIEEHLGNVCRIEEHLGNICQLN